MSNVILAFIEESIISTYVEFVNKIPKFAVNHLSISDDVYCVVNYSKLQEVCLKKLRIALIDKVKIPVNKSESEFLRRAFSYHLSNLEQQSEQSFFITEEQNIQKAYSSEIDKIRNLMQEVNVYYLMF